MAVYNSILNPSMNVKDRRPDHNTGNYVPYSCEQCVGSLTSHKVIMNKGCETGPMIYHPYPRRLDSLTIADIITKTALSPQLFKDPECWSGWGLNPRPPAQESGTLLTELTGWRLAISTGITQCCMHEKKIKNYRVYMLASTQNSEIKTKFFLHVLFPVHTTIFYAAFPLWCTTVYTHGF